MFNGTQKSGFWKQFGKVLGEKDLCYLAVRCLLATKDRKLWVDALHQYPYEKVEEIDLYPFRFSRVGYVMAEIKGKDRGPALEGNAGCLFTKTGIFMPGLP